MAYIRYSLVRPLPHHSEEVKSLLLRLSAWTVKQDGCIESFVLQPHDDSGEIARIAIYRDEHTAEHLASTNDVMAMRSQLDQIIDPTSHTERAFFTIE